MFKKNYLTLSLFIFLGLVTGSVNAFAVCASNPTNFLFVVDKSGSNVTSDPQDRRSAELALLHANYKSDACVRWGLATFQDTKAQSLISLGNKAVFISGENGKVKAAIRTLKKQRDGGGTPLGSALSLAKATIEYDLQIHPMRTNNYHVVILSDGLPTDGLNSNNVKVVIQELLTLDPSRVKVSAGFYGPSNWAAENLLKTIASEGSGKYSNLEHTGFDLEDLLGF